MVVRLARVAVILGLLFFLAAFPGRAQDLEARFLAAKERFLLGEPIYLVCEIVNKGKEPVQLQGAYSHGHCQLMTGHYWIEVPGVQRMDPYRCGIGGGSCPGGPTVTLRPAEVHTERLLVNEVYRFDGPGTYTAVASRWLRWRAQVVDEPSGDFPEVLHVESEVDIVITPSVEAEVEDAFRPILREMKSSGWKRSTRALQAVVAIAPPFLEQTILKLAQDTGPSGDQQVLEGLERLGTPAARREIAKFAEHPTDFEGFRQEAILALARTRDAAYLPLMIRLAQDKSPYIQLMAIPSVGEIGGKAGLPFLISLARSLEPRVRALAAQGLGMTCDRDAIPALISMMRDGNTEVRKSAAYALAQLTHLKANEGVEDAETATQAAFRWFQWWESQGGTAPIHGPEECRDNFRPLP